MTRTFVVGLDGASWDLLDPWLEDGVLPNLARLRDNGSWATSRSCLPPSTFPNWKCYSSGKNPGSLGVFWFETIDLAKGSIGIPDGRDFNTPELWDYLNDAGLSTGVVNMPTMYPPREIDGYVVCGGPDAVDGEYRSIDQGYTYPPEFEETLEERFDYGVHPHPLLSSNQETGAEVDAILDLLAKRFEVAIYLFEELGVEFIHVTLFYLNVLQHFFWDDEPTKLAWRLVDQWIGKLADYEETNLLVMSDHGCQAIEYEFYINEWLVRQGYLNTRRSVEDLLTSVGVTRGSILSLAKRLSAVDLLARVVPERLQQMVPDDAGVKRSRKLEKVILSETRALASGQGPIYVNPYFDVESVVENLVDELTEVTDHRDQPVFEAVKRGPEVYSGPHVNDGPEVIVEPRPGVHVNDGLGGGEIITPPDRWAAENTPNGIFIASGPEFSSQGYLGQTSILDITPTLLGALGLAIPTDMEGTVLPILANGVETIEHRSPIPLVRQGSKGSVIENVENRLVQLGYME